MKMILSAPAKVNLYLKVLFRREDGYHEIATLMQPLTLGDELTLAVGGRGLEFSCSDESLLADNLVIRAARAWFQAAGLEPRARLHLEKEIPVAAGLGGGSSDAAATLLGLNRLFDKRLPSRILHDLAVGLGADVPFFLARCTCFCTGVGDRVQPLPEVPSLNYVLINPGIEVSTGWVYEQLGVSVSSGGDIRNLPIFSTDASSERGLAWTNKKQHRTIIQSIKGDGSWQGILSNDLEKVTLVAYPALEKAKKALQNQGAAGTLMSGSGPTIFGLFQNSRQARSAARSIQKETGWWVRACQGVKKNPGRRDRGLDEKNGVPQVDVDSCVV